MQFLLGHPVQNDHTSSELSKSASRPQFLFKARRIGFLYFRGTLQLTNQHSIGQQVNSIKTKEIDGATVDLNVVRRRFCAGWLVPKTAH